MSKTFSNWLKLSLLRHQADAGLGGFDLVVDVVAEHRDVAAGLVDQRGDDADGGGLAGAVGAEQGAELAFLHLEIDAFERLDAVLVGLDEIVDAEGVHERIDGGPARLFWPLMIPEIEMPSGCHYSAWDQDGYPMRRKRLGMQQTNTSCGLFNETA